MNEVGMCVSTEVATEEELGMETQFSPDISAFPGDKRTDLSEELEQSK